jgi:hypothetical protein
MAEVLMASAQRAEPALAVVRRCQARVAALAVALLTAAITYGVALWALRVPLQTLWRR